MNDSHHVQMYWSSASCGILELSHIQSDFNKVLYSIASRLYHPSRGDPAAFLMWSDVHDSNGTGFANFLNSIFTESFLLTESDWVENPQTSNFIKCFLFRIPHNSLKDWYIDERVKRAKKL